MIRVLEVSLLLGVLSVPIAAGERSEFVGTWHGSMNGLPAIDLTLEESGGEIQGSVMFYLHIRGDDGQWRVKGKHSLPLLVPKVKGGSLEFEVIHHKRHGSSELGPNAKFRVELKSKDSAVLHKIDEPITGPGLKLTREKRDVETSLDAANKSVRATNRRFTKCYRPVPRTSTLTRNRVFPAVT